MTVALGVTAGRTEDGASMRTIWTVIATGAVALAGACAWCDEAGQNPAVPAAESASHVDTSPAPGAKTRDIAGACTSSRRDA